MLALAHGGEWAVVVVALVALVGQWALAVALCGAHDSRGHRPMIYKQQDTARRYVLDCSSSIAWPFRASVFQV